MNVLGPNTQHSTRLSVTGDDNRATQLTLFKDSFVATLRTEALGFKKAADGVPCTDSLLAGIRLAVEEAAELPCDG